MSYDADLQRRIYAVLNGETQEGKPTQVLVDKDLWSTWKHDASAFANVHLGEKLAFAGWVEISSHSSSHSFDPIGLEPVLRGE